jgi:hypothetical protein
MRDDIDFCNPKVIQQGYGVARKRIKMQFA